MQALESPVGDEKPPGVPHKSPWNRLSKPVVFAAAPQMRRLLSESGQSSPEAMMSSSILKTGLITSFTQDRVMEGVTTRYITAISATYIRGFYAHIAQTYSNIVASSTDTLGAMVSAPPSIVQDASSVTPGLRTSTDESLTSTSTSANPSHGPAPDVASIGLSASVSSASVLNSTATNQSPSSVTALTSGCPSQTSSSSALSSVVLQTTTTTTTSLVHPTGVISSEVVGSVVSSGTTTIWRRNVLGTYINGFYAHIASTVTETVRPETSHQTLPLSSQVSTSSSNAPMATATSSVLPTGLLSSKALVTETVNGRTIVLLSAVYGTYIGGHYAQYAKIERSTVLPQMSPPIGITTMATPQLSASSSSALSTIGPAKTTQTAQSGPFLGLITSTTTRITQNRWVTIQTVFTYGTYIQGYYAHIAKTSTEAFPASAEPALPSAPTSSAQTTQAPVETATPTVPMVASTQTLANAEATVTNAERESSISATDVGQRLATLPDVQGQGLSVLLGSTVEGTIESSQVHQQTPSLSSSVTPGILLSAADVKHSGASAIATSSTADDDDEDLKTGLISRSTVVRNVNGLPYMFTYDVTGTFINGFYAHIARTQSSLLEPSKTASPTRTERTKRPIVTFHISEPNDQLENQLFSDELSQEIQSKLEQSLTLEETENATEPTKPVRRTRPVFPSRRRQPAKSTALPEPVEVETERPPADEAPIAEDDYDYDYPRTNEEDQDQRIEPVRHQRLARAGSYSNRRNRLEGAADQKPNVRPTETGRMAKSIRPALLGRRRKTDAVQSVESSRRTETTDKFRQRNGARKGRKRLQRPEEDEREDVEELRQRNDAAEVKRPRQRGQGRRKINRGQQQREVQQGTRAKGRRQQAAVQQRQGRQQAAQGRRGQGKYNPKNNRSSLSSIPQPTSTLTKSSITLMSIETLRETSVIDGTPSLVERLQTRTLLNRKSEVNYDSTTLTEVLIATTVLEQVKTIPIQIGFRTRTDTITESSTLTQLLTSVQTIAPGPTAAVWTHPQTASPLQPANPFVQANPYLGQNLFANAFYNQPLQPQYLTSTIVEPATVLSTSVVSVNLRGRRVLKTLTDTKVTETTRLTTFAIQPTAAPLAPLGQPSFVTPEAVLPQFTTDITLVVTDQLGQTRPVVTRVVLPIHHGKVARSLSSSGRSSNKAYTSRQNHRKQQHIAQGYGDGDTYDDESFEQVNKSPSQTEALPPVTTILENNRSEIYRREASSHLARFARSAREEPVPKADTYVGRKLLQFQQPHFEPSSSYYLPQFTNYNDAPYASRDLQPSVHDYYSPPQYDFQQYQPYEPYHNQYAYSDDPYNDYHSQVR
ncbi:hypothetical protein BIW11_12529 [Tropilaelaps mercedesae]|uniref:DUF4758 domain-containing protein n=1 Tax=Tropilaelaps mercedesae TaxID=418985 RepID=A0A1V9X6L8_9ACAR|nr:hypothetical protein BIW11_12529 [Tropilaelaps mercedesae]